MSAAIVTYQDRYKTIHGSRQLSVIFRWACSALLVMLSERAKEGQRLPVLVLSPSLRIHLEVTLVVNLADSCSPFFFIIFFIFIFLSCSPWSTDTECRACCTTTQCHRFSTRRSNNPPTKARDLNLPRQSWACKVQLSPFGGWQQMSMLAIVDLEPEGAHLESNIIKPAI